MLVLSRRIGEEIKIGEKISLIVTRISKGQVGIGIKAPHDVVIVRGELLPPQISLAPETTNDVDARQAD